MKKFYIHLGLSFGIMLIGIFIMVSFADPLMALFEKLLRFFGANEDIGNAEQGSAMIIFIIVLFVLTFVFPIVLALIIMLIYERIVKTPDTKAFEGYMKTNYRTSSKKIKGIINFFILMLFLFTSITVMKIFPSYKYIDFYYSSINDLLLRLYFGSFILQAVALFVVEKIISVVVKYVKHKKAWR